MPSHLDKFFVTENSLVMCGHFQKEMKLAHHTHRFLHFSDCREHRPIEHQRGSTEMEGVVNEKISKHVSYKCAVVFRYGCRIFSYLVIASYDERGILIFRKEPHLYLQLIAQPNIVGILEGNPGTFRQTDSHV